MAITEAQVREARVRAGALSANAAELVVLLDKVINVAFEADRVFTPTQDQIDEAMARYQALKTSAQAAAQNLL
jgi:hypothetical protein